MRDFLASAKKFLAALTGAIAVAVSLGLLPDDIAKWVAGSVAVLTAFVVYYVKNDDSAVPPDA